MRQERQINNFGKDILEDFRALLKSDLWKCLPPKTKDEILAMLTDDQGGYAEQKH